LTSTSIINITVQPAPVTTVFRVKAINIGVSSIPLRGIASVAVSDINGVAVPNATVSGTWSGYFTGNVSGISNRRGLVTIISNTLSSKAPKTGTATFTVTSIVLNGYKYDATKNAVTIKTITR